MKRKARQHPNELESGWLEKRIYEATMAAVELLQQHGQMGSKIVLWIAGYELHVSRDIPTDTLFVNVTDGNLVYQKRLSAVAHEAFKEVMSQ